MSGWRSDPGQSAILLVDIQEKLFPVMNQREALLQRAKLLCQAAGLLSVPIYITEQVPDKLGPTLLELAESATSKKILTKQTFSACPVLPQIPEIKEWVLAGMESHICVRQTALDLKQSGAAVTVLADAVASRHPVDLQYAMAEFRVTGVRLVTVETLLFEWLGSSEHPQFKAISRLVKEL